MHTSSVDHNDRIRVLCELVLPGTVAADIGTDHARVPIALAASGRCPRVIAADRSGDALEGARRAVTAAALEDRIELRRADGLAALDGRDVATVVLAGLGGRLITRILARDPRPLRRVRRLVLAPQRDTAHLRRWLGARGWRVVDERLVEERTRFYWVLAFERTARGTAVPVSALEACVGSIARLRGDRAFRRYGCREERRLVSCLRALDRSRPGRGDERRACLEEELRLLRLALTEEGSCIDES